MTQENKSKDGDGIDKDSSLQVTGYLLGEKTEFLKVKSNELGKTIGVVVGRKRIIPVRNVLRIVRRGKEMPCEGCE